MSNRLKNLFLSGLNMLDVGIYPFLMLLATPFLLERLGNYQFGIWVFINTIIASLGVLNVGLGDTTIRFVSKYLALNDNIKVKQTISTTHTLYVYLTLFILAIAITIFFSKAALSNLLGKSISNNSVLEILPIAIAIFALKLLEQIIFGVFKGFQRYDIASKISIANKVSVLLVNIILAYLNFNIYIIFVGSLILTIIFITIEYLFLMSFYKEFYFSFKIDKTLLGEVFNYSIWVWGQSILSIIANQIDKFIVVYFSGLQTLTFYSIGLNVANQIHFVFAAAISWIFPKISVKTERGEKMDNAYFKLQFLILFAGLLCISILLIWGNKIFLLWLGSENYTKSSFFIEYFLYYEIFMLITIVPYYFFNASGMIKLNTLLMVITLIFKLICIPLFFYFWNYKGLVLGQISSLLISVPIQIYFIHKKVHLNTKLTQGLLLLLPCVLFVSGFIIVTTEPYVSIIMISSSFVSLYIIAKPLINSELTKHEL